MKIITDNKRLPRPILMVIATVGWALILHLCWRVLTDSVVATWIVVLILGLASGAATRAQRDSDPATLRAS